MKFSFMKANDLRNSIAVSRPVRKNAVDFAFVFRADIGLIDAFAENPLE